MTQQKPTMKIYVNELFKTKFNVFDDCETSVKTDQIKKVSYIEKIAHQLEKNLTDVNLFDILKNNNNIILATNKEINEALINFDREKYFGKPKEIHDIKELNDDQKALIEKSFLDRLKQNKGRIERDLNTRFRQAREYLDHHNRYMRDAKGFKDQLDMLKVGDSSPLIDSINKVLADDRFTMKEMTGSNNFIDFIIKDNVILTHKNEKAGLDLRVDFGKYVVRIIFDNGISMKVLCFEDNVQNDGFYHPHVNDDGIVCLGNVAELFNEALMVGDIFKMVDITRSVLVNYNNEGPYISLAEFVKHSEQVQPNGEYFEISTESRNQEHECSECGNNYEVEFQPEGVGDYEESNCPGCDSYNEHEFRYQMEI